MLASKWSESSGTLSSTYQVSNPHRLPQRCYRAKDPVWTWHLLHNPCPGPGYSLIKPSRYPFYNNWLNNCLENLSWSSGFKKRCCRRCGEAVTPHTLLESGTSACAGSTTVIQKHHHLFSFVNVTYPAHILAHLALTLTNLLPSSRSLYLFT